MADRACDALTVDGASPSDTGSELLQAILSVLSILSLSLACKLNSALPACLPACPPACLTMFKYLVTVVFHRRNTGSMTFKRT